MNGGWNGPLFIATQWCTLGEEVELPKQRDLPLFAAATK
jgi:hypothetical protein